MHHYTHDASLAALRAVAAAADSLTILRNHRGRAIGLACGPSQADALAGALAALEEADGVQARSPAAPAELPPGAAPAPADLAALAGLGNCLATLAGLPLARLAELVGAMEDRAGDLAPEPPPSARSPAAPAELPPGATLGPSGAALSVHDLGLGLQEVCGKHQREACDACGTDMEEGAGIWAGARMICPACSLRLLRLHFPQVDAPAPADSMRQGHR